MLPNDQAAVEAYIRARTRAWRSSCESTEYNARQRHGRPHRRHAAPRKRLARHLGQGRLAHPRPRPSTASPTCSSTWPSRAPRPATRCRSPRPSRTSAATSTPRPRSSTPAISPASSRRTSCSPPTSSPTSSRTRCSTSSELDREQQVIVQEIGAARDNPDDHVFDLFQEAAYPDQPIGRTILGTVDSVKSFDPGVIRAYMDRNYVGDQMVALRRRQRRSRRARRHRQRPLPRPQGRRRAGAASRPNTSAARSGSSPTTSRPTSSSASRAAPTIPTASTPARSSPRSSAAA